jgi:hypothetical protein
VQRVSRLDRSPYGLHSYLTATTKSSIDLFVPQQASQVFMWTGSKSDAGITKSRFFKEAACVCIGEACFRL